MQCTLLEIFSSQTNSSEMQGIERRFVPSVRFLGIRVKQFGFKKIVMKNIELLETVLPDIKRANLRLGIINLIQSYHSELLLFVFFSLPIITYFSFFHTHLSDIPYKFNCDFLDSHSTMTICSLAPVYTAFSVLQEIGQISQNKHMYFKNIEVNFNDFVFYLIVSFNPSWPLFVSLYFQNQSSYKFVEAKSRSFDLFP